MAISSFRGIPFGRTYTSETSKFAATKSIKSDGEVDPAFSKSGDGFISKVTDSRVQDFLATNQSPGEGWAPHELGGYDSKDQSLFVEDGKVVLRSNTEEDGQVIKHLIQAPFDQQTGEVNLEASTEGFRLADSGKTVTFNIPV